jgi:hypothetical protein
MTIDLSKKRPLVTIDDFVGTYENPSHQRIYQAQKFLKRKRMLPLRYTNKHLPSLNIIIGWLLWSGSVSHYHAAISVADCDRQPILDEAKKLGLAMIKEPGRLVFGKEGQSYARLCVNLGIYNSEGTMDGMDTKIHHSISLPPYLLYLAEYHRRLYGPLKIRARKILKDQCKIILITRLRWQTKGNPYRIDSLPNYESEANAENLAKQIVTLFNSVYPRMGLNKNSIRTGYNREKGFYWARILFRAENITKAISYKLFDVSLNRQYT